MSRRKVLAAGGAGIAAAALPGRSASAAGGSPQRIDVHCHHIPDFYRKSMAEHGVVTAGGIPIPAWSPELAVKFMNDYGIGTQIVSISEPGVTYLESAAERKAMARRINDYTRDTLLNTKDPLLKRRFGAFAVLPLADPDDPVDVENAAEEAVRAAHTWGLDGVGLFSNYGAIYLGDPRLELLMVTLNTLGAMVFVHPVTPSAYPDLGLPTFLYEFPFDTTRAAVNMNFKGVFTRHPRIRWLLAHAGGTLPFLSWRVSLGQSNGAWRRLFYDTALSPSPAAMKSVREVTSVSHVMFATDWPFSGPLFVVPGDPQPELAETFSADELRRVLRENQLAQFSSLRDRLEAS